MIGRRRHSGSLAFSLLRVFGLIAVAVMVVQFLIGRADAATVEPVTRCGDTTTWEVTYPNLSPEFAGAAIGWAYQQVAPVAGLTVSPDSQADVAWEWSQNAAPVDQWGSSVFGDRKFWLHNHSPDGPETLSALKTLAIVDVLHDLGVTNPTSTATGLSDRDREKVKEICRAQAAAPASVTTAPATPGHGGQVPVDAGSVPSVAVPPAIASAGGLTVLAVLVGLVLWMVAPVLMRRKRAPAVVDPVVGEPV